MKRKVQRVKSSQTAVQTDRRRTQDEQKEKSVKLEIIANAVTVLCTSDIN